MERGGEEKKGRREVSPLQVCPVTPESSQEGSRDWPVSGWYTMDKGVQLQAHPRMR